MASCSSWIAIKVAAWQPVFAEFISLATIVAYSVISPLINVQTNSRPSDCSLYDEQWYHMALFIVTMLVATFYFLVLDRSEFRERFFAWSARTFGTEVGCCSSSSVHLALYLALRLSIVSFWALFLGPEPLSCWIVVMDDEYSGFQVGRVVITSASGALLCYVFDKINTAGLEYSNLGERTAQQDSADQSSAGSSSA